MSAEIKEKQEQTESKREKSRGLQLWVLLVIVLFLFLITSVVLGSRLYKLATRDQHTVDLGMGEMDGNIELFRIEYSNELGEITVRGINADNVVAPGTSHEYELRLRNNDDVIINYVMDPNVDFLTEDHVPVEFKIKDDHGNYILGDDNTWVDAQATSALLHQGSIHPGEVYTYHIAWRWVFEVDQEQDAYDTYLGNQGGEIVPGVAVGIEVQASANPKQVKAPAHAMHLLGRGFGCCWCCWLVWILLLIIAILLIRIWFLRRKYNKQVDTLDEYEEVLTRYGLLVDGELVEREELELINEKK